MIVIAAGVYEVVNLPEGERAHSGKNRALAAEHGLGVQKRSRQCSTTRQTMNYVLAGLERRRYIERHAGPGPAARVVRMTDQG